MKNEKKQVAQAVLAAEIEATKTGEKKALRTRVKAGDFHDALAR